MTSYRIDWGIVAAWVQAVGSILAIWAAGRLVVRQERSINLDRVAAVSVTCSVAADAMDSAKEAFATGREIGLSVERLRDVLRSSESFTPSEVPDPVLLTIIFELRGSILRALDAMQEDIDAVGRGFRVGPEASEVLTQTLNDVLKLISELEPVFKKARRRLRAWLFV